MGASAGHVKNGVKPERKGVSNGSFTQKLPCTQMAELHAGQPSKTELEWPSAQSLFRLDSAILKDILGYQHTVSQL